MKVLPKEKKVRLCRGLTSLEVSCQCSYESCRATMLSRRLIKAYKRFRELVGVGLNVNSGFRCTQHNFDVGGSPLSRHLIGEAIDISLKTINHLTKDEVQLSAIEAGFTFVKFYKTFVHLDVREI